MSKKSTSSADRRQKKKEKLKSKLGISTTQVLTKKERRAQKRKQRIKPSPKWFKKQFKINTEVRYSWLGATKIGKIVSVHREDPIGFAKQGKIVYIVQTGDRKYPVGYLQSGNWGNIIDTNTQV